MNAAKRIYKSKFAGTYEDRIVAFVDILGMKHLVASGKVPVILKAMQIIEQRLKLIDGVPKSPLQVSQFSDSIILSAPNDGNGMVHTVHFASLLASELFLQGVWCRGAITSGKMHHRGNAAFGPALIDAVEMERSLAVYPRVLVTDTVAEHFVEAKNAGKSRWLHAGMAAFFRRDFDHLLHLDIFSHKMFVPARTGTITDAIKGVRRFVVGGIDASERLDVMKIQAKLFWIGTYLDYVEEVHGAWHFKVGKTKATIDQ
jgi:hypothetical protein